MKLQLAVATALLAVLAVPVEAAAPAPAQVIAAGFSFAPAVLVIPLGTAVEFRGMALPHTVTTAADLEAAMDGSGNDETNLGDEDPDTFSRSLPMGGVLRHTFAKPGTYSYHCELHAALGMVGTIVVE